MNNFTIIESFKDRLNQTVKIGDIVLYPRMQGQSPEMTIARIISLKEKEDYNNQRKIVARIKTIRDEIWGIRDLHPNARCIITTYETSLTKHADNLVKIDADKLSKLEYDVLVKGEIIPVYQDEFSRQIVTENKYEREDIMRITGSWIWGN